MMYTKKSATVSPATLNEQFARRVFELLPDQGPVLVLISRDGHCWPSDSERFFKLNMTDSFLKELCAKVDDGDEPLITPLDDCTLVASQLATEHTQCGYIIIALPHHSPESTLANIDLIEIALHQFGLILKLIEDNSLICARQMQHLSSCLAGHTSPN